MRTTIRRSDGVVTVTDRPRETLVRLFKYRLVSDRRRDGVEFYRHAHDERLDGLTVDHHNTLEFCNGYQSRTPEVGHGLADEHLEQQGATVL